MKRKILQVLFLFVIVALAIAVTYSIRQSQLEIMTDLVRAENGQTYIDLPAGAIAYDWFGPDTGEVVVLVHGFSTPKLIFEKNIYVLASAGYRVLRFDHFGRGFSDRPEGDYDDDFYDAELELLFDALQIGKPINLVGFSLGGGIVTTFAARHPELIKKLVLIAPVGLEVSGQWLRNILHVPGLGKWGVGVFAHLGLVASFKTGHKVGLVSDQMLSLYKKQFNYKGLDEAVYQALINYPFQSLAMDYQEVNRLEIPTALLWGTEDMIVPYSAAKKVISVIKQIRFEPIEGVGHAVVYEQADKVNRILIDLFQ